MSQIMQAEPTRARSVGSGSEKSDADDIKTYLASTSSASRILIVMEAIANEKETTLSELCQLLPYHRSSIWRAVDGLRKQGWVRMRMGKGLLVPTSFFLSLGASSPLKKLDIELIEPLVQFVLERRIFDVDFGRFVEVGDFRIIESSHKETPLMQRSYLAEDLTGIAAMLTMSDEEIRENLQAHVPSLDAQQRLELRSVEFSRKLRSYQSAGKVWSSDGTECSLPLRAITNTNAAMRISVRTPTRKNLSELHSLVEFLTTTFGL